VNKTILGYLWIWPCANYVACTFIEIDVEYKSVILNGPGLNSHSRVGIALKLPSYNCDSFNKS